MFEGEMKFNAVAILICLHIAICAGQRPGSLCPLGWNTCSGSSDCGSNGCCFRLNPALPANCCAGYNYVGALRSTRSCLPSRGGNLGDAIAGIPSRIGACPPRSPPSGGPSVGCPYMRPTDFCQADSDCPDVFGTTQLCCHTDFRPGCYAGKRCTSPILYGK